MKRKTIFPLLFLLASCANQNSWKLDDIAAGNRAFDSSKLRYVATDSASPLAFEMLRVGDNVEAFVTLIQGRSFTLDNDSHFITAKFLIDEMEYREEIPVREGGMKVRLSLDMAARITRGLQEGKNVSILIEGYEQVLESQRFARTFSRFLGKRYKDENLFKGLIQ